MNRLERSLVLLQCVNEGRLRHGRADERVRLTERELERHDEECRKHGQLSLLDHCPVPVPTKPSACDECGARAPAAMAMKRYGKTLWLCTRCRDGRLPPDERRSLEAHVRTKRAVH